MSHRSACLLPLFFCFAQSAFSAQMMSPEVRFSMLSQDGHSIPGVSLMAYLKYEALQSDDDCGGFVCAPSPATYKMKAEASQTLGKSTEGQLVIAPSAWVAHSDTARKLSWVVYASGLALDLCQDGDQTTADLLNVLPQFLNNKPVQLNPECRTVEVADGVDALIEIKCISPYSNSEIQAQREAILSKCHP